jgi:hypothetical protein
VRQTSTPTMNIRHFGDSADLPTGRTSGCPAARYATGTSSPALPVLTRQNLGPEVWIDAG